MNVIVSHKINFNPVTSNLTNPLCNFSTDASSKNNISDSCGEVERVLGYKVLINLEILPHLFIRLLKQS